METFPELIYIAQMIIERIKPRGGNHLFSFLPCYSSNDSTPEICLKLLFVPFLISNHEKRSFLHPLKNPPAAPAPAGPMLPVQCSAHRRDACWTAEKNKNKRRRKKRSEFGQRFMIVRPAVFLQKKKKRKKKRVCVCVRCISWLGHTHLWVEF